MSQPADFVGAFSPGSKPGRSHHRGSALPSVACTFARLASSFLLLVVFSGGCLVSVLLTMGLIGQLCGLMPSEGPIFLRWLSACLGLALGAVYLSLKSMKALAAIMDGAANPAHPIKSSTMPFPGLWDRDLDDAF